MTCLRNLNSDYIGKRNRNMRRMHEGKSLEKSVTCSLCPYTCRDSFQLRVHHRSHTSSRPFNCTKCNNSFSRPEDLKRHESHSCPTALPPFALQLSTPTACGLLAVGDLGLAWRGKQSRWTWGVGRDEFRLINRLGTGRFFSEMQKVADAADISVLFF